MFILRTYPGSYPPANAPKISELAKLGINPALFAFNTPPLADNPFPTNPVVKTDDNEAAFCLSKVCCLIIPRILFSTSKTLISLL